MLEAFYWRFRWFVIEQLRGLYVSQFQLMFIILMLVIIVPGYVVHIKNDVKWSKIIHLFLTIYYLGVIILIAIVRRESGSRSGAIDLSLNLGFSIKGFYSYMYTVYSLLNTLMFIPWGILIVIYRKREHALRAICMTTLVGFITSFCIEVLQVLTKRGVFEITDLFTNTLGTFLGAIIGIAFIRTFERLKN